MLTPRREPYELLTGENAALLLIDHQIGTMSWTKTVPLEELKRNTLLLAKAAVEVGMPIVMTTSLATEPQGPLMEELRDIAPDAFAAQIKRQGIVDALDDLDFAAAVKATNRNRLIMAGVTTEVCITFPAIRGTREGYDVHVVADASASVSAMAEDMAFRRMQAEGVTLTSTLQLVAELARSWKSPHGLALNTFLFEDLFSKL